MPLREDLGRGFLHYWQPRKDWQEFMSYNPRKINMVRLIDCIPIPHHFVLVLMLMRVDVGCDWLETGLGKPFGGESPQRPPQRPLLPSPLVGQSRHLAHENLELLSLTWNFLPRSLQPSFL